MTPIRYAVSLCLALSCGFAGQAHATDPQPYTVKIASTGNAALDAALAGSSQLQALRIRAPAGPFALVGRARADLGRLHTALESFGYYQGTLSLRIAGTPLEDVSLPDKLAAIPAGQSVEVAVSVTTGPLYHLRQVTLAGDVPAVGRAAFTLKPGDPAVAGEVLGAGGRVLTALQEDGYALAKVDPPVATEVPAAQALDVVYKVDAGPRVDLGPIAITGLHHTNEAFVRRRLLVHQGDLFRPSKIEAARQDLLSVGVFSGVQARSAAALDAAGQMPLTFDVAERKLHAVTFTATYSTDLGSSLGVTWSRRNLFGNAEQLNLSAAATGLGGSATSGLGYDVTAQLLKPDFLARDQQLEFDLGAIKQNLQAYDQTAETAGVLLNRKLSKSWSAGIGLTGEQEQILQEGVTRNYTLVAVPLTAKYDSTGLANPLDDALHGLRANFLVTPTESLEGQQATFVIVQSSASTYFDLSGAGRSVLALRGVVGTAQGATQFALPPDQRFYGGGSATVRGFKYQSIGPLFPDNNPEGGTAIDAGTIEFRQRLYKSFGVVTFLDVGQVNASSAPFEGTLREGVGVGARYYTPIGPIRLDIAVPLNKPPGGDTFELYIGLGQAF